MCSSPGRALALQARALVLLLVRSNPRSTRRMAVWSRDLHGAKALTIRFESAVLPTAKLLNWQRTSEFNKPEHWIFASPYKAGKKPRHRPHRLAHIPPHLPESFGRDWGSAQSAAGINAPCRHTNHHEHLRKSHGDEQARGTWQSRSPRSAFKRGLVPPYCPRGFLSR